MRLQPPTGMEDCLPERVPLFRFIEATAREVFDLYGFQEIRTPIFEYTSLFSRAVGETTDIVEKEMYTFESEREDSLTLRPELTAPVVRCVLGNSLLVKKPFQKLWYFGPVFRKERPQKGRLRQFHQIGAECLGGYDPLIDVETIALLANFLDRLGLSQFDIRVNSIGCPVCRAGYREVLRGFFGPRRAELCPNCNARFDRNVFRILDCKAEGCAKVAAGFPPIEGHLCEACTTHLAGLKEGLATAGIRYALDPKLVRGFDYYTKTVYEFKYPGLGAQDAIAGGGRYDNLIEEMGGPKAGAVGFGIGVERVVIALEETTKVDPSKVLSTAVPDFFVVTVSAELRAKGFELLSRLRREGLGGDMEYEGRSMKGQMRSANRSAARYALILGPDELAKGVAKAKDMSNGGEREVALADVAAFLRERPILAAPSGPSDTRSGPASPRP